MQAPASRRTRPRAAGPLRSRAAAAALLAAVLLLGPFPPAGAETPGVTTRESVVDGTADGQANAASGEAAVSADGQHVAFRSEASNLVAGDTNGVADVFVRTRATNQTTRVSVPPSGGQFPAASGRPSISADGNRVAFEAEKGASAITGGLVADRVVFVSDRDGNDDIFVMGEDGTGLTNLTGSPQVEADPRWSPDGRRIAFTRYVNATTASLFVMNTDGTDPVEVTPVVPAVIDRQPAWSPDGTRLVFSRVVGSPDVGVSYSLWILDLHVDLGIENPTQITTPLALEGFDSQPDWSPDGREVVFSALRDGDEDARLYVVDVELSSERGPLFGGDGADVEPRWSRDGQTIAFSSDGEVWLTDPSGGDDVFPISNEGTSPAWRGDDRRIAFVSSRDGQTDLYRMAATGELGGDPAVRLPTNLPAGANARQPDYAPTVIGTHSSRAATASVVGGVGAPAPTGTVSFFLCTATEVARFINGSDGFCGFGGRRIGAPVPLLPVAGSSPPAAAAVSPSTDQVTPPVAFDDRGTWCWRVEYSGDNLYLPSRDLSFGAQCFEVTKDPVEASVETEEGNTGFFASATFSSDVGAPQGLATFFLCDPAEVTAAGCLTGGSRVGEPDFTQANSGSEMHAFSEEVLPTEPGRYCWRVEFAGSGQHQPARATGTSFECFTIGPLRAPLLTGESEPTGPLQPGTQVRNRASIVFAAGVSLEKTGPDSAEAGETITYTFTIRNSGARNLTDVRLIDDVLGLETQVASFLAPGASVTHTHTYLVTQDDVDQGSLENTAFALATDPDGGTVRNSDSHTVTFEHIVELEITKLGPVEHDPQTQGSTVLYTVDLRNTGTVTLRDVTVMDDLFSVSEPLIFVEELPPGDTVPRREYEYVITQQDIDEGEVRNTALAEADRPDSDDPLRVGASHTVRIIQTPGIDLQKSGPPSAVVGEDITYFFLVTNTGNVTLAPVEIVDERLDVRLVIDSLAPDTEVQESAQYRVVSSDQPAIQNTATATGTYNNGTVSDTDSHIVGVSELTGAPASGDGAAAERASSGGEDAGTSAEAAPESETERDVSPAGPQDRLPAANLRDLKSTSTASTAQVSTDEASLAQADPEQIVFYLCGPGQTAPEGCLVGGTPIGDPLVPPPTGGEVLAAFTLDTLAEGTYCWRVEYGGDDLHLPVAYTDAESMCFTVVAPFVEPSTRNVYVRDRAAGTTTLVSVGLGGEQARGDSFEPAISADGRFVAFTSFAPNLTAAVLPEAITWIGEEFGVTRVYRRNLAAGTTQLVSAPRAECLDEDTIFDESGFCFPDSSSEPAISTDGQVVAFASRSPDLSAVHPGTGAPLLPTFGGAIFEFVQVYVRDMTTGATTVESVSTLGLAEQLGLGSSGQPSLSGDGARVAFVSEAPNLVLNDLNPGRDVFVRDREARATLQASIPALGLQPALPDTVGIGVFPDSIEPAISTDGRTVAFSSQASNLVAGDGNFRCLENGEGICRPSADVFVHDLVRRSTSRVSVDSAGGQTEAGADSRRPTISSDGRIVAFDSTSTRLVAGDTNGQPDVFLRDRTPVLVLTPDPVDFGGLAIGTPSDARTVTALNTGSGPLRILAITISGETADFTLDLAAGSCLGLQLFRNEVCVQGVRFTPTAEGTRSALLTFETTAPGGPQSVRLTGQGLVPRVQLSPDPADFGQHQVGATSEPVIVSLLSVGSAPVAVTSAAVTGPNAGDFLILAAGDDGCSGQSVAPTTGCGVTLRFRPQAAGPRTASLVFTTSAEGSPHAVTLTGVGTVPNLGITPDPADFGVVELTATSGPRVVRITNTGTGPVSIGTITLGGEDPDQFAIVDDGCSNRILGAGASCEVLIELRPTQPGRPTALLIVPNSGPTDPVEVPLSGFVPSLVPEPPLSRPGFIVEVFGEFYPPNTELRLQLAGSFGDTVVTTDDDGAFSTLMLVPRRERMGPRILVATGAQPDGSGDEYEIETDFLVAPGSAQPPDFVIRR